ncbi:hypothetical protein DNH61_01935 [Paenibacillus sambharensis]|uniref:Uncharacterized protein n=1 Tax=Paenibacillus sambharensis TaxID=1803190 RepID=A0A2W1LT13_9BACL|nr:hypothetical protein [Paenibacillus sambharensis]PZD97654.1 hypothetical protein DNH61_01935 [Paenibacillus sambharensis]
MREFKVLKLLDRFSGWFERRGADYPVMRRMLQVKLTMDRRRVPTVLAQMSKNRDRAAEEESNHFGKSLWLYGLMGLVMILFLLMGGSPIVQMGFIYAFLMFFVVTAVISDFSSVVLDVRDHHILHPKPVTRKTIQMAKSVHAMLYLTMLTGVLSAGVLGTILFKMGPAMALLFILETVLFMLLVLVATTLLYLLVLKYMDGEKLKDLINYVQIIMSAGVMLGYQLTVNSFNYLDFGGFELQWWHVLIVPLWFAAPFELLAGAGGGSLLILLAVLSIVVPLAAFLVYLRLQESFERYLAKLTEKDAGKGRKRRGIPLGQWLGRLLCRSGEERTWYRFAAEMMRHERDFKLKVYPALGFSLILPFLFLLPSLRVSNWSEISQGSWFYALYMIGIIVSTVLLMLKYSGAYKGAWIYKTLPLRHTEPVFRGSMLAFAVYLFLPIYLLESAIFILIFGVDIALHLLIILLGLLLYMTVCFWVLPKSLPFSQPFDAMKQNDNWVAVLLFFVTPVFGAAHFGASLIPYGLPLYAILLIMLNIWQWGRAFRVPWEKVVDS